MKDNKKEINKEYSKDDFLKDLQKACRPVSKPDKQKTSSNKT